MKSFCCMLAFILPMSPTVFAEARTTLVYTSNQPNILVEENITHFPQLTTLIKQLKKQTDNETIFLHGGDSFSPSPISLFDSAKNVISLANLMEVDAYSVGKRELSYDVDTLSQRAMEAQFPIISSSLVDKRTSQSVEGLYPLYTFEVGGNSIAIGSLISPRVLVAYSPDQAAIINQEIALPSLLKNMNGADIKVLMTDVEKETSLQIAEQYNFDLILVANDGPDEVKVIGQTIVAIGGGQDGDAIIVEFNNANTSNVKAQVIDLTKYKADPEISSFVEKYKRRLGNIFKEVIATSKVKLTSDKQIIRTRENALGNIFADAVKAYTNTDIAIINSGSMRSSTTYEIGYKFTRGDIQKELPFGNHHTIIDISGTEIWQMMENSVSRIEHTDGRFLNVSGIAAIYDSGRPTGKRIKEVTINGIPLIKNKIYSLTLQDFYLKGGDNYIMLKDKTAKNSILDRQRIWHIVSEYLAAKKVISAPSMGRLVDLRQHEG